MEKLQTLLDILLLIVTLWFTVMTWNANIAVEIQYIPTILNGLISATSITMGFSATAFVLMFSRKDLRPLQNGNHIKAVVTAMVLPIVFTFLAYMELLRYANFNRAFKFAAIGLIVAFSIFLELFVLMIGLLERAG